MEKEYLQNKKLIHLNVSTRTIQYHTNVLFEFKLSYRYDRLVAVRPCNYY